ncbi:sugar ABC transporter permease [bacterium]|nr:MAG: sugar ABC transporter permease [bacterium]
MSSVRPAAAEATIRTNLDSLWRRLGSGDVGSLPVILGLVMIWAVFDYLNPNFLSPRNLTNLTVQVTDIGIVSTGVVLVLLLGEIDLSVGSVYGLGSAVMAVLNVKHGWAAVPSIAAGVLTGTAIGTLHGFWFTRFRIPSFVVTLAGLLAWLGAQLLVLGETGTINIYDSTIDQLASKFFDSTLGWVIAAAVVAFLGIDVLIRRRRRAAAGLPANAWLGDVATFAVIAVAVLGATAVLAGDRGVPLAFLILLAFIVGFDLVTTRTRFGRHIFAVGGNAEAARRAGISVNGIRLAVFALSGTMAAIGGIMAASRLFAVNYSSGSGDVLLNAIAAAVIGGTSLFGGRGTVWSALTGSLVIGSINNGLALLSVSADIKYMITGGVLLAAVTIDAVARQGRQRAGV